MLEILTFLLGLFIGIFFEKKRKKLEAIGNGS